MRKADFPFLADWVAISLRWLWLAVILVTQVVSINPNWILLAVAGGVVVWNLFLSMLAITNRRMPAHRFINVSADILFSLAMFYLGGGLQGPLVGAAVLGLVSAAVYFERRGTLIATPLVIVSESVLTSLPEGFENWQLLLQPAAILAGVNIGLGILLSFLSLRLMDDLRQRFRAQLALRQEAERKAQQIERNRLQTFYSMIETLSATLDYRLVLESTLDLSISALGEDPQNSHMVCAVLLFGDENLIVGAARGFSPTDIRRSFRAETGILSEALRSGVLQFKQDPFKDPELNQIHTLENCKAAICLPLLRGLNAYGVMLFAHPEPAFFHNERRELLEMISHQAVIAIQNARLFQDVASEKNRIVESQEETRKKLARDLHDGPTQSVSAIAMRVDIARKMFDLDPQEVPAELERLSDLARRTTQEIRHMLFTLRPLALESEGLVSALQQMSDKMKDTFEQNVILEIDESVTSQLDVNKQTVVFYMVEEAINNARKHAEASEIRIKLKFIQQDRNLALLEISDNGKGFDLASVRNEYEKRGSFGMLNLQERSALISAALHIDSAPGKGTRIQIVIPLTQTAVDRLQRGLVSTP